MTCKLDLINYVTKGLFRETESNSSNPYPSVSNCAELPDASQNIGSVYIVQNATGIWPFNFKQKGLYRSDGANWNYLGVEYDTTSIKVDSNTVTSSPIELTSSNGIKLTTDTVNNKINIGVNGLRSCYTLLAAANSTNPVNNSTTYYIGGHPGFILLTSEFAKIHVPMPGNLRKAYFFIGGTAGSDEVFSAYIRINSTTDYLISDQIKADSANNYFSNTNLNIPLQENDYFTIKITTPNWTTNPQYVRVSCLCYIGE